MTSATTLYNGQVGADGYVAQTFNGVAVSQRMLRFYLEPVGGCPEPEVCEEPIPCAECPPVIDCDACPACPLFPIGVSFDACLAGPLPALNPTIPLLYCCNVPAIPNDDPACGGYTYTPVAP